MRLWVALRSGKGMRDTQEIKPYSHHNTGKMKKYIFQGRKLKRGKKGAKLNQ